MPMRLMALLLALLSSGCAVVAVGDAVVSTAAVVVKTGVNAAGTVADVGLTTVRRVAGSSDR